MYNWTATRATDRSESARNSGVAVPRAEFQIQKAGKVKEKERIIVLVWVVSERERGPNMYRQAVLEFTDIAVQVQCRCDLILVHWQFETRATGAHLQLP